MINHHIKTAGTLYNHPIYMNHKTHTLHTFYVTTNQHFLKNGYDHTTHDESNLPRYTSLNLLRSLSGDLNGSERMRNGVNGLLHRQNQSLTSQNHSYRRYPRDKHDRSHGSSL